MGRRKGSLNKKTIERLKAEGKFIEANNFIETNNEDNEKDKENKNFSLSKTNQDNSYSFDIEDTVNESITKEENTKKEDTKGEIKNNLINESIDEKENKQNKENKENKLNKSNKYKLCQRCFKEIYCEPRKIDTNILTGMADYHRETPRYIILCDSCCKELSNWVDKFLCEKEYGGNEDLRKFPSN